MSTFDVFVSKLNAAGTALIYSTYLGGTNSEGASGIAVDSSGNAYVTGMTSSTDFPTHAAFKATAPQQRRRGHARVRREDRCGWLGAHLLDVPRRNGQRSRRRDRDRHLGKCVRRRQYDLDQFSVGGRNFKTPTSRATPPAS